MGKKKRGHPDVEEVLSRPWCYYCERDFEDLKLLISHQKAKHFKCDRCGKRLNTAGGLSVHMNQVHKENLTHVENALPNRQGLEVEIFGMEGVPEDIVQQRNQRIIQNFYTAQAERYAATGNPPPGQSGGQGPTKKIKIESGDELKKRLAEHRARLAAQKAAGTKGAPVPDGQSPAQGASPFPVPQAGFSYPPPSGPSGSVSVPVPVPVPVVAPGAPGAPGFLPARPANAPPASGLPQRPPYYPNGGASTVDELVASAAAPQGDDIDRLIRMAEAGIKPEEAPSSTTEKKAKKDKDRNSRMVYADTDVSPEEKMATMARYAVEGQA